MDGDLQASEVGVVEELGQLVRIDRQGSGVLAALVWSGDRRGARADRAVDRQVAADRLQTERHHVRDLHVGDVGHHVEGEVAAVAQQDLGVPPAARLRDGHLVHAGDPAGRGQRGRFELELAHFVIGQ